MSENGHMDREDLVRTMRRHHICVLIPTYNNAATLRGVVDGVLKYADDVIVVNDGSTDATADILASFGDSIVTVSYGRNRGKGAALKHGFRRALELGYEYAVTIDSDGQHFPGDLPLFVRAIAENRGALIVGERDLSGVDINGKSSFANRFSNFWFNLQTGLRLRDTQTGYRAYPLKRLRGLSLLTSRYEAELELMVFASWHGVRIVSIPIRVYYPPQSERVSHFRPVFDFSRISVLNTLLCVCAVVYGLPARGWNALRQKRIFTGDFRPFTHRNGERREAAVTLGRLVRSVYGITYFTFWSMAVFTPFACMYLRLGGDTEKKKLRFHRMLCWISGHLVKRFPGAATEFENPGGESLAEPALIVCNHQSHLDIPVIMSRHPKLIFLTNAWAWNNPLYRDIIRNAEFLPVSEGLEAIMPRLRDLRERGYSIVIFPEGTRSADCSILRFHQGAFMLAAELGLDIVPMVLHGAGHYLPKKDLMFRRGVITLSVLDRIPASGLEGLPLRKQASMLRSIIRDKYDSVAARKENMVYFRSLVSYKYAWRGWNVVSRCRRTLKDAERYSSVVDAGANYRKVRILNSGIGVFPLLYALVNRHTEVYAFECDAADHKTAVTTAALPANLHFVHVVWESGLDAGALYDATICLCGQDSCEDTEKGLFRLEIRS